MPTQGHSPHRGPGHPPRPGSPPDPRPGSRPDPRPGSKAGPSRSPNLRIPFPNRTNRRLLRMAALLRAGCRWVLAAATGEAGRRVARAVALTVVLAVLVTALYDRGEVPVAAAQPAVTGPAGSASGPAARARGGAARRADPGSVGGLRGRERPAPVGERPAAVAAAWYAARQGVPRSKVKPLQQDRLSAREVRVLVLADHGRGRLSTALVRVRLGRDGWSVR
jgi:hypothetical protein